MVCSREDKWVIASVNSFAHCYFCCSGNHFQGHVDHKRRHSASYIELNHLCLFCIVSLQALGFIERWQKPTFFQEKKALQSCILYSLVVKDAYFVQIRNFCGGCIEVHTQAGLLGDKNKYANIYWRFINKNVHRNSGIREVWKSAYIQHKNSVCCSLPATREICLLMRFNHPGSILSHLPFSTDSHWNM